MNLFLSLTNNGLCHQRIKTYLCSDALMLFMKVYISFF